MKHNQITESQCIACGEIYERLTVHLCSNKEIINAIERRAVKAGIRKLDDPQAVLFEIRYNSTIITHVAIAPNKAKAFEWAITMALPPRSYIIRISPDQLSHIEDKPKPKSFVATVRHKETGKCYEHRGTEAELKTRLAIILKGDFILSGYEIA